MADLNYAERRQLEEMFEMGGGYVLGFNNSTFREFVHDSTGKDIYGEREIYGSGDTSKAKRLRIFWGREDNNLVGKLVHDLLEHRGRPTDESGLRLYENCCRIADRLRQGAHVAELSALKPNSPDPDFEKVAKAAREAIDRNEPEVGLGLLHTFMMWFVRALCDARQVVHKKDAALHALFGQYVKHVRAVGLIESEMTDRILRSCTSIFDAFNDVRNNRSPAHANSILNYEEALLIYNHVCSVVRFLQAMERKHEKPKAAPTRHPWSRQAP